MKKISESSKTRLELINNISINYNLCEGLTKYNVNALHLLNASGFAINYNNEIQGIGDYPGVEILKTVSNKLNKFYKKNITNFISTNNISSLLENEIDTKYCGVLFFKISNKNNEYIIWFRPEQIDTKT